MNTESLLDGVFRQIFEAITQNIEQGNGGPFGAAVVLGETVVGLGTNHVLASVDVSRHAEIEALAQATQKLGRVHLKGATLLTSHFPCMMCYHAIKWAGVEDVRFVFDSAQTRELFAFRGDAAFLSDLHLHPDCFVNDPSLHAVRYRSPIVDALYLHELTALWNGQDRAALTTYDIAGGSKTSPG